MYGTSHLVLATLRMFIHSEHLYLDVGLKLDRITTAPTLNGTKIAR